MIPRIIARSSGRARPVSRLAGTVIAVIALVGSLAIATPAAAAVAVEQNAQQASQIVDAGIVKAAPVVGFNAENIISDALFYDNTAMTAAEIQAFLDARIGTCNNGKCLNVLNAGISSRGEVRSQSTGNLICSAIQGGTMKVSELIYRVQVACGISAKVILVTLQKEQGLTTSKAPSDWNLSAAMGASCPDTAPCDPAFAGVGPQILKGTQQLMTYKAANFAKQPGRNYVAYSPNASCGGTTLNIQNYATAALYNYTPYQPNGAALAAGFGLGDGCSAYGNRNFYNYYTQWFGGVTIVDGGVYSVGPDIFLVAEGKRFHVTAADWPAYQAAFGSPTSVQSSLLLSSTADGGTATRYLRDSTTFTVAYLDGGTTHRFATCDMVRAWGGDCASTLTGVSTRVFSKLGAGSAMTMFARVAAGGRVHEMSSASLVPYLDTTALAAYAKPTAPYAAVLSPAALANYRIDPLRTGPGRLVQVRGDDRVWLPVDGGAVLHVPSFGVTDDLGIARSVATITASDLKSWAQAGTLSPVVSCAGKAYLAASGSLYALSDASGLSASPTGAAVCGVLKVSKDAAASAFVQVSGRDEVYALQAGVMRHVTSPSKLVELAGKSPRVLKVTAGTLARFTVGPALLSVTPGQLVRAAGDSRVWLPVDGGKLLYVPSFGVTDDLGLSSAVAEVSSSALSSWAQAGTLSPVVSCGGTVYLAASGVLYALSDASGTPTSPIGKTVCDRLTGSTDAAGTAFLQVPGRSEVYLLQAGTVRHVKSMTKLIDLAGTTSPRVLQVTAGTLARFGSGSAIG
ncbi:hypothetical protein [Microbacterium memoriense]|uniref:Hemagglutinin n=1 Tax=Microbacterium memoriense TaxID=2978350 RepID=A0ABT2PDV2_9MICO|nr:hypothetical protein [Microbacterium memoriense]MCT9002787.1 hypothetical protein [Microbacterium memoriense]